MMQTLVESFRERWGKRLGAADGVGIKAGQPAEIRFAPTSREFVLIANTADVDLEDEVVVPAGALEANGGSMRYFLSNRKVFWAHNYGELAVGSLSAGTLPSLKARGWFCRVKIANTDTGDALCAMAEDGAFPASSIGFQSLEARSPTQEEITAYGPHRSIVTRWHWLELSLTHMPMNVACQSVDGIPAKAADEGWVSLLDQKLTRGVIKRKSAQVLGLAIRRVVAVSPPGPRRIVVCP